MVQQCKGQACDSAACLGAPGVYMPYYVSLLIPTQEGSCTRQPNRIPQQTGGVEGVMEHFNQLLMMALNTGRTDSLPAAPSSNDQYSTLNMNQHPIHLHQVFQVRDVYHSSKPHSIKQGIMLYVAVCLVF